MSDISASNGRDRLAEISIFLLVFGNQFCQIVDAVEEGNPAIVVGVVSCDLIWGVVASQFIRSWEMGSLFKVRHPALMGRWYSCGHFKFCY